MSQAQIKVLIVNDQEDVCQLWHRLVNNTGDMVSVGYVLDGQQALQSLDDKAPDVVLMDVMMPAMDGYETTRRIKVTHPHIHIIIYSAYTGKGEEAYEAGASQFLLMPITPDRLISAIRQVMGRV